MAWQPGSAACGNAQAMFQQELSISVPFCRGSTSHVWSRAAGPASVTVGTAAGRCTNAHASA